MLLGETPVFSQAHARRHLHVRLDFIAMRKAPKPRDRTGGEFSLHLTSGQVMIACASAASLQHKVLVVIQGFWSGNDRRNV
jgi:hypothetical protein